MQGETLLSNQSTQEPLSPYAELNNQYNRSNGYLRATIYELGQRSKKIKK